STNQAALLLGDATTNDIQQQLYNAINSVVTGAGKFKLFSDVGLTIGNDSHVNFDSTKFASAYAADPTAVENLFTQAQSGLGKAIDKTMNRLVDPVGGEITLQESTLNIQIQQFQD